MTPDASSPKSPLPVPPCVAVIGAGSIGVAWSIVFARSGMPVRIAEPDPERRARCLGELIGRLEDLQSFGLLDEPVEKLVARVEVFERTEDAAVEADHVQECVPEDLGLKKSVFAALDAVAPPETTLASSSSAIRCSEFASDLAGRARCMVVHPGNPPYLLPIAELVPAPFTSADAVDKADDLLRSAGMSPVRVHKEIEGFVYNRLQGALLREAYCLVRDGVISPRELDQVVAEGLGRRWSVIGPFAVAHLNTRGGLVAHAERLGPAYARMGADRGQNDPWTSELVDRVAADIHETYPLDEWDQSVRRRDRSLMHFEAARRDRQPDVD